MARKKRTRTHSNTILSTFHIMTEALDLHSPILTVRPSIEADPAVPSYTVVWVIGMVIFPNGNRDKGQRIHNLRGARLLSLLQKVIVGSNNMQGIWLSSLDTGLSHRRSYVGVRTRCIGVGLLLHTQGDMLLELGGLGG